MCTNIGSCINIRYVETKLKTVVLTNLDDLYMWQYREIKNPALAFSTWSLLVVQTRLCFAQNTFGASTMTQLFDLPPALEESFFVQ